jgi:hypothetical protein
MCVGNKPPLTDQRRLHLRNHGLGRPLWSYLPLIFISGLAALVGRQRTGACFLQLLSTGIFDLFKMYIVWPTTYEFVESVKLSS